MGRIEDRIRLVNQINKAALLYKDNLVGKRFMYVFDSRFIEVLYRKNNFRHLTGVDTDLSADQFFRDAVRGRLTAKQIYFNERHPYDLCLKKLEHISQLATHATNDCFMLENIMTNTAVFKFGATDLRFTVCLNLRSGECYDAESLRDGDCFTKSQNIYTITHIFSMSNDEKLYTSICFKDKNANNNNLSSAILEKVSPCLRRELGIECN